VESWGSVEEDVPDCINQIIERAWDDGEGAYGYTQEGDGLQERKLAEEEIKQRMPAYKVQFIEQAERFGAEINEYFMSTYHETAR
jgi:hypothetical protein